MFMPSWNRREPALIAQTLLRVFKNIAQQILASPGSGQEKKKVDKKSDKQCDDL